jgi:GNAT superfamily N-acetyltransferase
MPASGADIAVVTEEDLHELLPLVRAYCDFYEVAPSDADLLALSRALIAGVGGVPHVEGVQLIARDTDGVAVGFATIYWTWQTLTAARCAVMNDLYVAPEARGTGLADDLIAACAQRAREHGARELVWQTARSNKPAQAVYRRVGAQPALWVDYTLPLDDQEDRSA